MSTDLESKPQWIQKDSKGGYKELLCLCIKEEQKSRQQSYNHLTNLLTPAAEVSKITAKTHINVNSFAAHLSELLRNHEIGVFLATYSHNKQFINIYNFVAIAKYLTNLD